MSGRSHASALLICAAVLICCNNLCAFHFQRTSLRSNSFFSLQGLRLRAPIRNSYIQIGHQNRRQNFRLAATTEADIAATEGKESEKNEFGVDPKLFRKIQMLTNIWGIISFPGDYQSVEFILSDYGLTRYDVEGFLKHFQMCKDCAGDGAFLMATSNEQGQDTILLNHVEYSLLTEDGDDDDWGMFDRSMLGDEAEALEEERPIFPIVKDDEEILSDSKEWVRRVIADFGVCPFTTDPNRAGIPMGGVRYSVSRAVSPEEAFYRYWEEVILLLQTPEKTMSTVLLVFPEIELFGNFELFEMFCESLQDALTGSSLGLESEIQLVFFHPKYQFRDGGARTEVKESACNYARRAPWPMVNILRTPQVRAAQRGVPTGVVYKQNEERLREVGAETLERMLYDRNWEGLPVHSTSVKANRKASDEIRKVDVLDPVLTDLSSTKAERPPMCPYGVTRSAAMVQSSGAPSKSDTPETSQVPTHQPLSQPTEASTNSEAEVVSSNSGVSSSIDYLKLADDVDEWLASGGF